MEKTVVNTLANINVTHDYSLFKNNFYNRELQKSNLIRIKESVLRNNLLPANPIIVTDDLTIIDGNHRFNISRELNLPIYYVKCDKFDIQMLIDLNFSLSKWGPHQFLQLYKKMEKIEYIKFQKFLNHFDMDIYLGLPLTKKRESRNKINERFRKGEFIFENEEDVYRRVKYALEFLEVGKEILILKPSPHKDLAFFDGYFKLMDLSEFNQDVMVKKLRTFGIQLLESANATGYYTQLTALLRKR